MKDVGLRIRVERQLETPGESPPKYAHDKLDQAVREAYGMTKSDDPLAFLLDLNQSVVDTENSGGAVVGPGLPPVVADKKALITGDCIRMPGISTCVAVA